MVSSDNFLTSGSDSICDR